jgi:alkanesulfonate monooxygenase SsuD/methylene tetrahydromethanopterin reductase-like flavin-dependent oxidoreductase (luciferase family)
MTFYRESPVVRRFEGKLEDLRQAMMTERGLSYKQGQKEHKPPPAQRELSLDHFQREGFCIIGDPDFVIEQVRAQERALGAGTLLIYLPFGTLPVTQAEKSLELFSRAVLPHLREEE